MLNISKYVDFYVDIRHSDSKNKDFYPVIMKISDIEVFVGFISESQYKLLSATLN